MRTVCSVLSMSILILTSMAAQVQPFVQPGARVRVTTDELDLWRAEGICLAISDDSMRFAPESGAGPWTIPLESMKALEVSQGRRNNAGKGALTLGLIGAIPGAALGFFLGAGGCGLGGDPCPLESTAIGAAVLGVPLAAVGALAGALTTSERWADVSLQRVQVSLAPQRDGRLGIGLTVAF